MSEISVVVVTDCGSTTTKALMFEKISGSWKQTFRGEAPTTVEAPVADVTQGALNAFYELEELSGRKFINEKATESTSFKERFLPKSQDGKTGIDIYLSTSSAGGGLQMLVCGVVSKISADSASRAALGAGAIVLDALALDDSYEEHERIAKIRALRPDIVLLTGGVDGGAVQHVLELCELLVAASPRPRFGDTLKLPVVYAGNKEVSEAAVKILSPIADVTVVENVRPTPETENLLPAREAIHDLFLSHVMSHAPGYGKLMQWSPEPIMPTPAAVGEVCERYAREHGVSLLCADIGGATTDVFTVYPDSNGEYLFHRSVSANLGMSYSIGNVLLEAGAENIKRWLPFEIPLSELKDRIRNKMLRPTSIPQTIEELQIEQAVCREALRLSLHHHERLAVGLGGKKSKKGRDFFSSKKINDGSIVNRAATNLVIGSGGVLSHAPNRLDAAMMMLDGFELRGISELCVDSIFMMPHLGVFSRIEAAGSKEIFESQCLVRIAHSVVLESQKNQPTFGSVTINGVKQTLTSGIVHQLQTVSGLVTLDFNLARGVSIGGEIGSFTKQLNSTTGVILIDTRQKTQ